MDKRRVLFGFREESYGKLYKITGILRCDTYLGCGTPYSKNTNNMMIGPSGSGKSTLMYCMATFQEVKRHRELIYVKYKNLKQHVMSMLLFRFR